MIESVIIFELLFACNAAIGVLTLMSLITDSTLLKIPIAQWQQIFGYVVSGCALAVYIAGFISIHMLYRSLLETTLVTQDEASGLVGRASNVGRVAQAPTAEQRFPGTGYKLQV